MAKYIHIPAHREGNKWIIKALRLEVEGEDAEAASKKASETLTNALGCVISIELRQRDGSTSYDAITGNYDEIMKLILEYEPECRRPPILKRQSNANLVIVPSMEEIINYGYDPINQN